MLRGGPILVSYGRLNTWLVKSLSKSGFSVLRTKPRTTPPLPPKRSSFPPQEASLCKGVRRRCRLFSPSPPLCSLSRCGVAKRLGPKHPRPRHPIYAYPPDHPDEREFGAHNPSLPTVLNGMSPFRWTLEYSLRPLSEVRTNVRQPMESPIPRPREPVTDLRSNTQPEPAVGQGGHEARKRANNSLSQSAKRARIPLACEECRARKVRCDGTQPVCGACWRRRKTSPNCTYQSDKPRDNLSTEYVETLERRLHQFESQGRSTESEFPHNAIRASTISENTRPGQPNPEPRVGFTPSTQGEDENTYGNTPSLRNGNLLSPMLSNNDSQERQDSHRPISEPNEGMDGMGNTGMAESSYSEWGSSAASFMKQIQDTVAAKTSFPGHGRASQSARRDFLSPAVKSSQQGQWPNPVAEYCVLPPRRSADQMLEVYWKEVHHLYPFLHRPSFLRVYQSLWTADGPESNSKMAYCILNTLFAICCQVKKRSAPEEQGKSADIFFKRAMYLLRVDIIGPGSMSLIAALLLMGQYLQSTEWPQRCWVVVGIAIRVAQGLGLHLPQTTARMETQQDREMARRLWHGCVFMDRYVLNDGTRMGLTLLE